MRKLVLITRNLYARDFLTTGAFEGIDDDETHYVTGPGGLRRTFEGHPRFAGAVELPQWRREAYAEIRDLLFTHYRFRSRTARVKLGERPFTERTILKLRALPGLRQARIRRRLRQLGLEPGLRRVIDDVQPDLLIAPAAGIDGPVFDAFACARSAGVRSLALMYNWDNLSSKAAFPIEPDYLGVIGTQSAEHATAIHGISPDRVAVLGSPYIDRYFRHPPGSTASPFPFPYVLFAGCYQPFDERTALERLDAEIERQGLDLKIVYLPHPRRLGRDVDDFVDEERLAHVLVEPHVRDHYVAAHREAGAGPSKLDLKRLSLDAYPALLENAEFVVCPLSTMMLESAILRRKVLVIAYHDGVHATSPGVAIKYLHFEGVDRVDAFHVCRRFDRLAPMFSELARERSPGRQPPKEQMDYWVYHDERNFGERLAEWVDEIGRRHGLQRHAMAS